MSDALPPSKEDLKAAMKAFKKRLKLTRLEEESKLTRRPTTSGQPSAIVAIVPPNQFGPHLCDRSWCGLSPKSGFRDLPTTFRITGLCNGRGPSAVSGW